MRVSRSEAWIGRTLLVVIVVLTLVPLVNMLSAALQPADINPTGLAIPANPHWDNFATAFTTGHVWVLMGSSLLIVVGVVPISLLFATLAGYALGNVRFKGDGFVYILFLLGLTIPFPSLVVAIYYEIQSLGFLNSQMAVILPLIALFMPFSVVWMRTHFVNVPRELSEAARVDGATTLQELLHVQLPLAVPALSSLAILLFLWTWNQFLLPVVLIADPMKRTVAGALTFFQGTYQLSIPLLNAGALIIILPTILVFVIFQRQFIKALLQGAIKG